MASVEAIVSRADGSIATPVQACSAVHAPGAKGPGLYGSTEGEGHLRKRIPKAKAKLLTNWCPELQTRTPQPKAQGARSSATMQTFLARFERLRSQQRLLVGQVKTKAHNYTVLMKYQAGPQNHFKFCSSATQIMRPATLSEHAKSWSPQHSSGKSSSKTSAKPWSQSKNSCSSVTQATLLIPRNM